MAAAAARLPPRPPASRKLHRDWRSSAFSAKRFSPNNRNIHQEPDVELDRLVIAASPK